jgi:hypothetical protein
MIPETTVLQKLVETIKGIFVTSTDGIVGQLNRTITRLENHSDALFIKGEDLNDAADALRAEAKAKIDESVRAGRIAANLGKLLVK